MDSGIVTPSSSFQIKSQRRSQSLADSQAITSVRRVRRCHVPIVALPYIARGPCSLRFYRERSPSPLHLHREKSMGSIENPRAPTRNPRFNEDLKVFGCVWQGARRRQVALFRIGGPARPHSVNRLQNVLFTGPEGAHRLPPLLFSRSNSLFSHPDLFLRPGPVLPWPFGSRALLGPCKVRFGTTFATSATVRLAQFLLDEQVPFKQACLTIGCASR